MKVFEKVSDIKHFLRPRQNIGFVPTMGALHRGHASLLECARKENEIVVLSIFVNPTQFAPGEDLEKYPRTLEADLQLAENLGVDVVFLPTEEEIYPLGKNHLQMNLPALVKHWCGASRPTHFQGVIQVVAKLLNIVRPDFAYFGQKDYQQLVIIKHLVRELFFDTKIKSCPIVREADGLAMSSRNRYLSEEERKQAVGLFQTLEHIKKLARTERNALKLVEAGREFLKRFDKIRPDYLGIANGETLEPIQGEVNRAQKPIILIAGFLRDTRLIDNSFLFEN